MDHLHIPIAEECKTEEGKTEEWGQEIAEPVEEIEIETNTEEIKDVDTKTSIFYICVNNDNAKISRIFLEKLFRIIGSYNYNNSNKSQINMPDMQENFKIFYNRYNLNVITNNDYLEYSEKYKNKFPFDNNHVIISIQDFDIKFHNFYSIEIRGVYVSKNKLKMPFSKDPCPTPQQPPIQQPTQQPTQQQQPQFLSSLCPLINQINDARFKIWNFIYGSSLKFTIINKNPPFVGTRQSFNNLVNTIQYDKNNNCRGISSDDVETVKAYLGNIYERYLDETGLLKNKYIFQDGNLKTVSDKKSIYMRDDNDMNDIIKIINKIHTGIGDKTKELPLNEDAIKTGLSGTGHGKKWEVVKTSGGLEQGEIVIQIKQNGDKINVSKEVNGAIYNNIPLSDLKEIEEEVEEEVEKEDVLVFGHRRYKKRSQKKKKKKKSKKRAVKKKSIKKR